MTYGYNRINCLWEGYETYETTITIKTSSKSHYQRIKCNIPGPDEPKAANGTEHQNGQKSPQEAAPAPVAPEPKAAAAAPAAPEPARAEPPKRVRVPPGGFSSGLW